MRAFIIIAVLVGLYYYFVMARHGMPLELMDFKRYSPEHYQRVQDALGRFESELHGRGDIHSLTAHREIVLKHMYELKMRLPNDTKLTDRLQGIIDDKGRSLQDAIQRIRIEKGKRLEFPDLMGDYFMHLKPVVLEQDRAQSLTYSSSFSRALDA